MCHTVMEDGFAVGSVISSPFKRSESDTIMKKARPQWLMAPYRRFGTSGPIITHGPAHRTHSVFPRSIHHRAFDMRKHTGGVIYLVSCKIILVKSSGECSCI